ncbi:sugar phosphate isomerase/epimerase [Tessaracoccus sp. MC1865]|nr:sugar phosphate isomerase/epimerase family protein [Tessaracoccus sp. MC1865]MBB1482948.1 sugar phosphate isomerase/epimerase [Tessaracoccus sp. MC1865]
MSRRQLFAASTGIAAAAAFPLQAAANPGTSNAQLVPGPRRGIILYTVRDAISRDPASTPFASGFRSVFEALAEMGYRQVEFAGYNQHANAEGGRSLGTPEGARLLRSWLDDNGLVGQGSHGSVPGAISDSSLASFDAACEVANILGMKHVGTGSDPTGSNYKADWDLAVDRWNFLGERAWNKHGLKLYTHNHDAAYNFLLDSGPEDALGRPTRSSGIRKLEYFIARTEPKYVHFELDIYWGMVAQYKHQMFTAPDGEQVESIFDPLAVVQAQTSRFPLFHAKDGRINTSVSNGYEMVPFGTGDIDFATFFKNMGARGNHHPMYEQDNAPGGAANPGQSLEFAALSYQNMANLRG